MMWGLLFQLLISGLVLGSIYAAASAGLGIAWGIMHVINFAHGEWIMLAAYLTYWLTVLLGIDPYLSAIITIPTLASIGFIAQEFLVEPVLKARTFAERGLSTILTTFGMSTILIGLALTLWKENYYVTPNIYAGMVVNLLIARISGAHLIAFIGSLILMIVLYLFFKRTFLGKAILAGSEMFGDPEIAQIVGINIKKIRLITLSIAGAFTGASGTMIATFFYVYPYVGLTWSLIAFVAVVLGGLGSFSGLLIAGLIIGILEEIGAFILGSAYSYLFVYTAFLLILYLRPRGLFGRR